MLTALVVAGVAVVAVVSLTLQSSVAVEEEKADGGDAKAGNSADTSQYDRGRLQCGVVPPVLLASLG